MLDIVASYRCVQFKGKLMNQTWENEKPSFGLNFGLFGPNLGRQIIFSKIWLRQLLDYCQLASCAV